MSDCEVVNTYVVADSRCCCFAKEGPMGVTALLQGKEEGPRGVGQELGLGRLMVPVDLARSFFSPLLFAPESPDA